MSSESKIKQAAEFLYEQKGDRQKFGPMPEAFAPLSTDEAYAIQYELHELVATEKGPIAGYKVALTSRAVQEMAGVSEPAFGGIFASTIHESPSSVRGEDYLHLGIECEIAIQLGADLPPREVPYNRDTVAEAVWAMMAAFELLDDRYFDYSQVKTLKRLLLNLDARRKSSESAHLAPYLAS